MGAYNLSLREKNCALYGDGLGVGQEIANVEDTNVPDFSLELYLSPKEMYTLFDISSL